MLLKVTDPRDGSTTILQVTMIDYEERSSELKIWDSFNNSAIVRMEDDRNVLSCANYLFENGKAQTYGVIVWNSTK